VNADTTQASAAIFTASSSISFALTQIASFSLIASNIFCCMRPFDRSISSSSGESI